MKLPFTAPKTAAPALALTGITGNLARTADGGITAWYELGNESWSLRADAPREAWIRQVATQYAGLATLGAFRLHLRRTSQPWPTGNWGANLLRGAVDPTEAVAAHIRGAVDHLDQVKPAEPVTFLGVQVPAAGTAALLGRASALIGRTQVDPDQAVDERVRKITDLLRPAGLAAMPATPTALAWLLLRSAGLGLTVTERDRYSLGGDGLLDMAARYRRFQGAYGTRVRYVDTVTGETAWVTALTVGNMGEQHIPERNQPWLHLADRAGFDVEMSSRVSVVPARAAAAGLHRRLDMLRYQIRDYTDRDLQVPPELERLTEHATRAGDEAATARPGESTRVHGWHRIAVWGATETECEERAAALIDLYEQQSRIALRRAPEQARTLREFVPGEPVADTGFARKMPVQLWAAAGPQVTMEVGDRDGDLLGWVSGTRTPVTWNPHRPMQLRDKSGLAVFVAEPGGGKSTLIGSVAGQAAIRGVRTTILDPSGPLAALADLPQLRGRARALDLCGALPGTLAPYPLVPTPSLEHFDDRTEWDRAARLARAERKALATDVCMMLLPPQLLRRDDVVVALGQAVRAVPAEESSTLDDVVAALYDGGDIPGKLVAGALEDAAELPLASLLFGRPTTGAIDTSTPLLVITLGGLRLPDLKTAREYWSIEERLALPMLHAAHLLAARRCYGGDMNSRKLLALDEAHFMEGWASGRALLVRIARDSRKWNLAALVASQNPRDILSLDVQNLVSTVFAGRIADDEEIAAEALRLLRVTDTPDGRYRQMLAGLSQQSSRSDDRLGFREFVMRDVAGRIETVRVDFSWSPELLAALNTTPTGGSR